MSWMALLEMVQRKQVAWSSMIVAISLLWNFGGKLLRWLCMKRLTVSYDIPCVAIERGEGRRIKGAAVICGGSIAGLLSARICANHFEEVIIIEPEEWTSTLGATEPFYDKNGDVIDPSRMYKRKRIEQYESVHTYIPVIREVCEALFPGFDQAMINGDGRVMEGGIYMQHRDARVFRDIRGFKIMFGSRDLFERTLRREVMKCTIIRQITGTATGVKASANDLCKLEGVNVRLSGGSDTYLPASLIVDCTGPTQAGHKWLKRLFENTNAKPQISKPIPIENLRIEYNANIVARKWRAPIPPEMRERLPIPGGYDNCGWVYSNIGLVGLDYRMFVMNRIDGHRFEVASFVRAEAGYVPPSDPEDLVPFVETISDYYKVHDWVLEVLRIILENKDQWEDLGTDSRLPYSCVQYERAPFLPNNFVAVGDSYARVNPLAGQGLSKAGATAVILDSLLRRKDAQYSVPSGFGRRFANDYQWSTTVPMKGEDRSIHAGKDKLIGLLLELATKDDFVDRRLGSIRSFLCPPTDLLHPKLLIKLAWFILQKKLGFA